MPLFPDPTGLLRAVWSGAEAITEAPLLRNLVGHDHIRLAVTGLTRAGKTVFFTSLISNLLAAGAGRRTLPALEIAAGGRLRRVRLLPAGAGAVPRFDHAAHVRALAADPPHWPERTADVATISLALTVERASAFRFLAPEREITLELLDYPGEWLLDLPMLDQDFAFWSAETLQRMALGPRAAVFAAFRGFLDGLSPRAPADEAVLRQGFTLYRDALRRCRDEYGLHLLQPGRFLNPGPRGETPLLWFFPLPPGQGGGLAELCARRFAAYQEEQRAEFLDPFFRRFDRQVVLADVLGALHAGADAFNDTADTLARIAASLRANAPWWNRLLGVAPSVVFAATKADHVPERQREALATLLASVTSEAEAPARAVAALRCTEDAVYPLPQPQGPPRPVAAIRGILLENGRAATIYPGEVPLRRPGPEFWQHSYFEMPVFQPPRIDPSGLEGLPHLGLDALLVALLGDLL